MATSTNYTDLAYDAETVFGTTNATPQFTILPTTGGSPVNNISTAVSEVIRSDRQTDDLVVVDGEIGGDISFELSYAPYADFMGAVLMNNTTGSLNETLITNDGTTDDTILAKASLDTIIEVGDVFKLTSVTDSSIDGFYTAISSTTGTVTIFPGTGTTSNLSDVVATATEIRKNGADPIQGYTIRKKAINAGTPYYWYYTGCAVNTMNLNFATGSILNGSVGIIGLTEETRLSPLTGEQTDIPTPAYTVMNSVTSIGTIRIGGVTLGTCSFSSLDLTIDNQINSAKSIGTLGACDLSAFSLRVTGSTEVYFNNLDLYNKFVAAESFSVTIILTDGSGNTIGIDMPKCKFESLDTPISGKDAFLMQSGTFKALRDATTDYMIKFSRVDA
jgi:hypothetical protein